MSCDFLRILQEKEPTFSKGQKRIARYITEAYDKAAFMTANRLGKTVIVVTHDEELIRRYRKRTVEIRAGEIISDRIGLGDSEGGAQV